MNTLKRAIAYQWDHLYLKYIISFAAFILLIFSFYLISSKYTFPFSELTTNPYSDKDLPVYAGMIQKLGMVLWIASAAICFFVVYVKRDKQNFFLFAGFISSFFALDELVLLHNKLLPIVYSISQNIIYAIYGIVIIMFLVKYRERIFRSEFILLYTSLFFLLIKIFIDGLQNMNIIAESKDGFVEDSAKLVGIFFWFYYFTRFAYYKVRDNRSVVHVSSNGDGKVEGVEVLKKQKGG